jgi:hypothetical protein
MRGYGNLRGRFFTDMENDMTSVNAELYHREFDEKNERANREANEAPKLVNLYTEFDEALSAAEQSHRAEGYNPYAFILGYLIAAATDDEAKREEIRVRLRALCSGGSGA